MMNYKLVNYTAHIDAPSTHYADILETTTDQVIKSAMHVPAARELLRYLNMGGGFDGWTPAFFLERIPQIKFGDNE